MLKLLVLINARLSVLLLLVSAIACPAVSAGAILEFENFSNNVRLTQLKGNLFEVLDTTEQVYVADELIVKVAKHIDKTAALRFQPEPESVTTLYEGADFNYLLLKFVGVEVLQAAMQSLSENEPVWLVQPNILQVREAASIELRPSRQNDYLQRTAARRLWRDTLGEGVKVAVIDDGFDLRHPDLNHVNELFAYDFSGKTLGARPQLLEDRHGSLVAGVIFGGHNGFGIEGLAPQADLIALRQADTWTSKTLLAFQLARLAQADVINCSWTSRWLMQPVADVVRDVAVTGRNNKGLPVIFAAGNQGRQIQPWSTEAAIDEAIVVGASDNNGERLRFSNYGSSVDILATGLPVTSTSGIDGYDRISGTSLASAIVTGYVTLLLAQNSSLSLAEINDELRQHLVTP